MRLRMMFTDALSEEIARASERLATVGEPVREIEAAGG